VKGNTTANRIMERVHQRLSERDRTGATWPWTRALTCVPLPHPETVLRKYF
jgi:hypothetical protein